MKDRIKNIMENEEMTPAQFADSLQINRAVISHILNGRNNPSLDVVSKILADMPHINPSWLINGVGQMYAEGYDQQSLHKDRDLFDVDDSKTIDSSRNSVDIQETKVNMIKKASQLSSIEVNAMQKAYAKKIKQIIIYYDDNTFETFVMEK